MKSGKPVGSSAIGGKLLEQVDVVERDDADQADRHRLFGSLAAQAGGDRAKDVEGRGGEQPLLRNRPRATVRSEAPVGRAPHDVTCSASLRSTTSRTAWPPLVTARRATTSPPAALDADRRLIENDARAGRGLEQQRVLTSAAIAQLRVEREQVDRPGRRRVTARAVPVTSSGMAFTPTPCRRRQARASAPPSMLRTGAGRATARRRTRRRPGYRALRPAARRRRTQPRRATSG